MEFGVEAEAPDYLSSESDPEEEDRRTDVPPPYRRLVGPNQWPDAAAVPGFKPAVLDFLDGMGGLSQRLMVLLAVSLHLPGDYFDPTFGDDPNVQMKIARYPPAHPDDTDGEGEAAGSRPGGGVGSLGVGAHTDSGYLSILLQDDVGGLQVQNGDGDWIDAPPLPGCMVVNLGEMLQLCTGGYYLATPHRVVSKPSSTSKDRISVPYFLNPRLDAIIAPIDPLPATLAWARPRPAAVEATGSHGDGGNMLLGAYGANALKSLARSHPEVMLRHHPDLEVKLDGTVVRRGGG